MNNSQDKEDLEAATAYDAQRGVEKYDGVDDPDGQRWHQCKDQIKTALEAWSRRIAMLVHDEQQAITASNAQVEAAIMFDDMDDGFHGGSQRTAKELYTQDYAWEATYIEKSIHRIKQDLYKWYLTIFTGTCLTKVKSYGVDRVNEIYNEFDQQFGKISVTDVHDKELKFEKGIVKKDGQEMYAQDDAPEMFRLWEKSQEKLKLEIPADLQDNNTYLTEKKLIEVIVKALHPIYADTVGDLRFKTFMLHCDTLTPAEKQAEYAKGSVAWAEYPIKLKDLKDVITRKYKQNQKIWAAERVSKNNGKAVKVLSYGGPEINRNGKGCWDCGSLLHRRGDDACEKKGQLLNAPKWLKDKIASGKSDDRPAAARKKRSVPTCKYWKKGNCKFGSNCKFLHPENEKGIDKGNKSNARLSDDASRQSRADKFKNELTKVLVAAVKEARGDESSGEEDERPSKKSKSGLSDAEKKIKVLIAKAGKAHNILMIRGQIGKILKSEISSVNQYGPACIDVNLLVNGGGPHHDDEVAFDNCAKVTASNRRSDFLSLDTSTAAKKSARIVGVGGEAVCGGRGIFMIVLKHNRHGTWVLVDPDAIYLEPKPGDSVLRCVSANKIEDLGMVISKSLGQNGVSTVLRDPRS